jgi:NAD(P)-dependent dehydrogenase (short-subunit alcohol dehydrogenase family)
MTLEDLFTLKERVALVTGGSRGVGRAIATGFIAAGAKVYVTGRKAVDCETTAAELGPNCVALPGDVSTVAGIAALAESFRALESKLDILVNNAATAWAAKFTEFPEKGWDNTVDLCMKAPFFMTQAMHPSLKAAASAARPAKVINITSTDATALDYLEVYSYHAAKAGLAHLTRRMAAELAKDNIVVTALSPGHFPSGMNRTATRHEDLVAGIIPAGRVGMPEDAAGGAIFLASRAGDYVLGSTLAVDGGFAWARLPPSHLDRIERIDPEAPRNISPAP